MGNYEQLKEAVSDVIKTNGNQEITGEILQSALLSIISIVGANSTFAGIAVPETNPGTIDQNVFYLASEPGIYINFGGVELIDQVIVLINKSGNWVKADSGIATNITEFSNGGKETIIPHGLTITDGLVVSIVKGTINTSITLTNTAGEKVTKQLSKWIGCRGEIIKFISISGTYTNITLSHSGTWMDKDSWIFGNSYTDFWPSKCYANGGSNFYLDGYSGRSAQGGYDSLLLALKYGKPKRIVWMLGMNNPDTEIAVNESWNNIFNELKELCVIMNIQLIPCTIPNVPERIHTFKNQIIRNSGLPYIDISSVLGANEKGSNWFSGLLSSDNVHPTGLGSEIIANTIIAGVPDIVE